MNELTLTLNLTSDQRSRLKVALRTEANRLLTNLNESIEGREDFWATRLAETEELLTIVEGAVATSITEWLAAL
jgi:hypothetical protein